MATPELGLNAVQIWRPTRIVLSVQVCQHGSWITSGLGEPACSIFRDLGNTQFIWPELWRVRQGKALPDELPFCLFIDFGKNEGESWHI